MPNRPSLAIAPAALAALAASAAPALAGDLLVVDPGGGPGTFATIQLALNAATSGDVVLVKSGVYESFFVTGKSVDVIADVGEAVFVQGGMRVADVPAGGRVLYAGMIVQGVAGPAAFGGRGLTAIASAGAVRIEGCQLVGADDLVHPPDCEGWIDGNGWEGARVTGCADVVFVDCQIQGGMGVVQANQLGCQEYTGGGDGGPGLYSAGSDVAVYGTTLVGADGAFGGWGGRGGDGIHAATGSVLVVDSVLTGGDGGVGFDGFCCGPGGSGGHGLLLASDVFGQPTSATGELQDVVAQGGSGGNSIWYQDGLPGKPVLALAGNPPVEVASPAPYPGPARRFESPGPVREGTGVDLVFAGEPHDLALVLVGAASAQVPLPPFQGWLQVGAPQIVVVGSLGAAGQASLTVPIGPLPLGETALAVPLQGVVLSQALEIVLATPRTQVIVDAGA